MRSQEDVQKSSPWLTNPEVPETRAHTIERVLAQLDGNSEQNGTIVISGQVGVGKSWMNKQILEAVLRSSTPRLILRARGMLDEVEFRFAALGQLLRPVLSQVTHLDPSEGEALRSAIAGSSPASDDAHYLHMVATGLLSLLRELGRSQPVVLLIDDAHWLDAPTRKALAFVSRRLSDVPATMIISTRDDSLARSMDSIHIPLDYLSDESARLLVRSSFPHLSATAVERVVASAGGLPLALMEIPNLLDSHSVTDPHTGQMHGDSLAVLPPGPTLLSHYRERISRLSTTEVRAVVALALEDLARGEVKAVFQRLGVTVSDLAAAEHADLIHWMHGVPRIKHVTIKGAIHSLIPGSQQLVVREAISETLVNTPNRAARHLITLIDDTVPDVADGLEHAARDAAERQDLIESARLWELAADKTLQGDTENRRLRLVSALDINFNAGIGVSAHRLVRKLLRFAADENDVRSELHARIYGVRIHHAMGTELTWTEARHIGVEADAVARLLRLAAENARTSPSHVRTLLTVLLNTLLSRDRFEDAEKVAAAIHEYVPDASSDLGVSLLLECVTRGVGQQQEGDLLFSPWREVLNDEALIKLFADADTVFTALVWCGVHGVQDLLIRYRQLAETRGIKSVVGKVDMLLAHVLQRDGYWAQARDQFRRAEQSLWATDFRGAAIEILLHHAWLTAALGREGETRLLLERAASDSRAEAPAFAALQSDILGTLALSQGNAESAVHLYEKTPPTTLFFGRGHPAIAAAMVNHIEALWRSRRVLEAEEQLRVFQSTVAVAGQARSLALVERCQGMLAADFEWHFRRAAEMHAQVREERGSSKARDVELARTEFLWGMRLRRARRKNEATQHLHRALAIFQKVDALTWASAVQSELKACGERRVEDTRLPDHLRALTPREYEIASEAAVGRTNVEIAGTFSISPRTVEQHLGVVYQKLRVRRRTELKKLFPTAG